MATRKTNEANVDDKMRELGMGLDDDSTFGEDDGDAAREAFEALTASDDDGEEPAPAPVPARRSPLRDALFERSEVKPPPVAQQPPQFMQQPEPRAPLSQDDDTVFQVPQNRVRKIKPEASPAVKRLGQALAKKLPGAEKVKIKQRMTNGQLGLVGEYSFQDLSASSDLESFILKYIKPKYGPGEYKITGIDAAGNELEAGTVNVLDPNPEPEGTGTMNMLQSVFEQSQRAQRELWESRMQQGNVDPIGLLRGIQEVQKEMAPKEDGTLAAVIAAQGQQMQAFMQMMAQQQQLASQQNQQNLSLLVEAMRPKEDPELKRMLAKLLEEKSSGGSASLPPPLPPPPAPFEGLKEIVEVMATVMGKGKNDGEGETKDLLRQLIASKDAQTLTPRDMLALMQDLKGGDKGGDDFRKSMEHMSMMLNVAQQLRGDQQGSSAAGFWDALGQFLGNRDVGGAVAQMVRQKSEASTQAQLIEQRRKLMSDQKNMIQELRKGQPAAIVGAPPPQSGMPVQPGRPVGVPAPQPVQAAPAAPVQTRVVRPVAAPVAIPAAPPTGFGEVVHTHVVTETDTVTAKPSERPSSRPAKRLPPLPSATYEHINKIVAAADDGELLQRVTNMLIYFAEFDEWRATTETLLGLVQKGRADRALEILSTIMQGLQASGFLSPEMQEKIVTAFDKNFDVIQSALQGVPLGDDANPVQAALDAHDEQEEDDEDDEDEEEDDEDEEEDDEDESDTGDSPEKDHAAASN